MTGVASTGAGDHLARHQAAVLPRLENGPTQAVAGRLAPGQPARHLRVGRRYALTPGVGQDVADEIRPGARLTEDRGATDLQRRPFGPRADQRYLGRDEHEAWRPARCGNLLNLHPAAGDVLDQLSHRRLAATRENLQPGTQRTLSSAAGGAIPSRSRG